MVVSVSKLRLWRWAVLVTVIVLAGNARASGNEDDDNTEPKVISSFQDAVIMLADHNSVVQEMAQNYKFVEALDQVLPYSSAKAGLDISSIMKLMSLFKNLNVKPIDNSTRCVRDLYRILQATVSAEIWALNMIDSFGKPSSGILQGNFRWPGSYRYCRSIKSEDNITDISPAFGGQYCTLNLIPALNKSLTKSISFIPAFQMGLCLPDTCTAGDINGLIVNSGLLPLIGSFFKFGGVSCREPQKPFWKDTKALVAFIILMLFLLVMALGTIYDLHKRRYFHPLLTQFYDTPKSALSVKSLDDAVDNEHVDDGPTSGSTYTINSEAPIIETNEDPFATTSIPGKLLLAFSVYTNGSKLLNTSPGKGSLPVLNGIRVLSITWVILGHTYSMELTQMDNVVEFLSRIGEFTMQTVLQGTVSVDSFFVLSGLLLTYLFLKEHERTNGKISWIKFYVHRYCRLTPTYLLVMFLIINGLWGYWGDGPFWPSGGYEQDHCYKSWWWNILYINNFQNQKEQCMGHTWYLANDMQFYVISPIFLIAMTRCAPVAGGLIGLFALASWITTGVIGNEVHNPANFDVQTLSGDKYEKYFEMIYIKPYCRIGPYLVGMVCGWLLYKTKCNYKMDKKWVILGWMLATACNLSVIYGLYDTHPNMEVSSLYYALSRTAWGVGLSWVIFACCNGYGGIVTSILNQPIWNPLSRLTYCAYLWHIAFLVFVIYQPEVLDHYEPGFHMVYKYVANVFFSYLGAFFISLAFESPIMTIEKIILGR